ncbi:MULTISPECIES: phosphate regulon sensor histidine kinase PhoR [unclassified Motilimonas]|uniref:phosphate regulon sensor histidine kinase PhoR n=1 Tax=Motilimonas TaxID=1914248 RepID=UPI001E585811|nr:MULTISPECIES: phosphate regulon sensor histidine kinase PhoR [unclassified Motilimonas]MCE0557496.1 phosphate regulon sensor histidine kinase PhoR [Motilimonas sp. E26]MDO6528142.1 phosphate regulon sensor histidine kinase PhoR [Motilimonas sp. 1_MG-2023]
MLQPFSWMVLFVRVLFFYIPFIILGLIIDELTLCLLIATVAHLAWHYNNQKKLADWLWHDRSLIPPNGRGSWEIVFNGIYKLQQRHRVRRRELASVIRRFREGAEALPDAAVVFKTDGSIIWCNRLAEGILGFRWPEDAGQHIGNLIRTPHFVDYLKARDFDTPLEVVSPVQSDKLLEFRIMPYTSGQNMLVARDVTHVRQLEAMRRNFVSSVSHELRTPLTVLKGYLEMIEDAPETSSGMWGKAHHVMAEQTARMDSLVEQLLTLSRIEATPDVDLEQMVDIPSMLSLVEKEAQALSGDKKHQLVFEVNPDLKVHGDAEQLRSAISNLVYNAVYYTPANREIKVQWLKQDQGAHFAVTDKGNGIAPEHISRLTERFYRVDKARSRETGGSGLGLSIVKHALSHHNSALEIESEVGVGSRFSFTIPSQFVYSSSTSH